MIFDSHAHYDDEQFDVDREQLLGTVLPAKGVVGIINMAASYESIEKTFALTKAYPYIYGALGIHPECAANLPNNYLSYIENFLSDPKIVAIGEIGLDYYYEELCPREVQKKIFIEQIELAKKYNMPIIVHDRDAHGDTMDTFVKYP